jgi:hypothetical protein
LHAREAVEERRLEQRRGGFQLLGPVHPADGYKSDP